MATPNYLTDDHPIFEACKMGDVKVVATCLNEGISVYAESDHNPPIAGIAAHHEQKAVLELLLERGLDIRRPYNRFGSSLALLAIKKDNVEWLEYFLRKGIPVDAKDNYGCTLLALAAAGGKTNALKCLLQHGAEISESDEHGGTPFFQAARDTQLTAMEMLHAVGSHIDAPDRIGRTPLIVCAKGGKFEATKWLLDHRANTTAKDDLGKTALDWAKINGHANVVALLERHMRAAHP